MQRALREARVRRNLTPREIANWVNSYPGLLTGGEHDVRILSLSPDHPDPGYRCECLAQKAWVHRVAGRTKEARRVLEAAVAMEVSDAQQPAVQRRWAQAYAELGDVEEAVALLDSLLEASTLVAVESLSTRYTWEPVRNHAAFQEMLARHR